MDRRAICGLVVAVATQMALSARAEFPYPANPRPCTAGVVPDCIASDDFASYLFLPEQVPLVLPNDFSGGNRWKLTSEATGDPTIDANPQELFGVTGASVDLAWQITTGRPDVVIAVLDSGIEWQRRLPDLVNKFSLNRGELPVPEGSTNAKDPWDRNLDGVFNVRDYEADGSFPRDGRVRDENGNGLLDPEDLIFLFSDGTDGDGNGYVDDISGWDFFEDDNDPLDEVEYGHGTGEAHDSTAEANNGGNVGTCPNCMVLMVRVADSFIGDVNAFARGVLFAVDSGALVVQEALGTLNNSSFAQEAIDYAYRRGVVVIASAADEESNHHNYPAAYAHTVVVNSVTRFATVAGITMEPRSYLYLNGCTNFGPRITLSVPSSACSSEATGLGSGIAGLVVSAARNAIDRGTLTRYPLGGGTFAPFPLSAEEVKQILIASADDINFAARPEEGLPENYAVRAEFPAVQSERFRSIGGFDQYFGYGRINARRAVELVRDGRIPPEATIEDPPWFAIIEPARSSLPVRGRVAAMRASSYRYELAVAPGVQPSEGEFELVASSSERSAAFTGVLGELDLAALARRLPHGTEGPAVDEQGKPDPDRFTVTLRLRVRDNRGLVGEDRRVFFLHRDADWISGEPRSLGADGAASPVFADIDGDGREDLVLATSDGTVHVLQGASLQPLPGWPAATDPMEVHTDAPAFRSGEVRVPYTPVLGTPAVGDLDGDGKAEIVAADLYGKVYVWNARGERRAGFPQKTRKEYSFALRSERDLTDPNGQVPDRWHRLDANNRLARGFGAGPVLANLDGSPDGSLEILAGAGDRHVYAWYADGRPVPGWPVLLKDPAKVEAVDPVSNVVTLRANANARMGTKIIVPPSVGDIDGDGRLDVVAPVNEAYKERPNAQTTNVIINFLQLGGALDAGNTRLYAIAAEGTLRGTNPQPFGWNPDAFLAGWPVRIAMLTTELLPVVGTGTNGSPALADLDGDGAVEIATFSMLGPAYVLRGNGTSFLGDVRSNTPRTAEADVFGAGSDSVDAPAYPALGGPVLAEMLGRGLGFQLLAPVAGLGKLLDANLPARQFPAENQLGVWDVASPAGQPTQAPFRPGFPHVVNDLQFLVAPIVADITGDGIAEAIWGSGVYDLHAVDAFGREAAGWPKFTGGWSVGSPAVGDIDGDGSVEVAAVTREGMLFVFRTRGLACGHHPWPQYHHDPWSTGNYHTDAWPPAKPQGTLRAFADGTVWWETAGVPGDDLFCGTAARIEARVSTTPIDDEESFETAQQLALLGTMPNPGREVRAVVSFSLGRPLAQPAYVALRSVDDAGNRSQLASFGPLVLEPPLTPTSTATPSVTATLPPTATPIATATPSPTALPPTPTTSPTQTVAPTFTTRPTATATSPAPSPTRTATAPSPDSDSGCQAAPGTSGAVPLLGVVLVLLGRRFRATARRRANA